MRVLFFGYSQAGHRAVQVLEERGDDVAAVVTHRDDPHENRWYKTPAEAAHRAGFPVVYSDDLSKDEIAALAERAAPDLVLSVFYRDLLPDRVLRAARRAALNLHPSFLPRYRGRAPLNWVLVHGESETGVTLHHMVARADAGDIVAQRRIPIAPRETALSLYYKIEEAGTALLRETLPLVAQGTAPRIPQDITQGNYVGRRRPEDGRIDWSWPARRVDCLVRAVAPPWPGAFVEVDGQKVGIHAGEPGEPASAPAGTVRVTDGKLSVACADRWFRVDEGDGLERLRAKASS